MWSLPHTESNPSRSHSRAVGRMSDGFAKGTGYIMPSMQVGMWTPNRMPATSVELRRRQARMSCTLPSAPQVPMNTVVSISPLGVILEVPAAPLIGPDLNISGITLPPSVLLARSVAADHHDVRVGEVPINSRHAGTSVP